MPSTTPTPELHEGFSEPGARPTPWDDVVEAIRSAELFWISTVRADGRPHVTPLPAVWHEGALHFCTGPDEQKAVNLRDNDHCILTTGANRWKAGLDVVVEGQAVRLTDDAVLRVLAAQWDAKYDGDWGYEVRDGAFHHDVGVAHVFEVRPARCSPSPRGSSPRPASASDGPEPGRVTPGAQAAVSARMAGIWPMASIMPSS